MVAAGKRFPQTARSEVSQWVSCNKVVLPASNHLLMRWRFRMFCIECGSTSHLTFHEAKPGPSVALRSFSAASRSAGVCSAMRSDHVAPFGTGVWWRMVHNDPGERILVYTRGIWPIRGAIQFVRTRYATWPGAAGQNSEAAEAAPRARCKRSLSLLSAAVFGRNSLSIPSWTDRTCCFLSCGWQSGF